MLDTISGYEANLRAHYRQVSQRLNRSPVPKPVNENPARSDIASDGLALRVLAEPVACGAAIEKPVKEWVSAQDYVPRDRPLTKPSANKVRTIIRATCKHFGIDMGTLLSDQRNWGVCRPRQVAMYLSKTMALKSYPEIGRQFKGRDHTTAINAIRRIESLLLSDQQLAADVAAIRALAVAADPGLGS